MQGEYSFPACELWLVFTLTWLHVSLGLHANELGNSLGGDDSDTQSVTSELGSSCTWVVCHGTVSVSFPLGQPLERNDKENTLEELWLIRSFSIMFNTQVLKFCDRTGI